MKKLITGAAAAAIVGGLLFAPNAIAEPSDACATGEHAPGLIDSGFNDEADPSQGGHVTVCVTEGPVKGNATASGPADQNNYIVADGDSTNQGALKGYIGVQSADDGTVEVTSSGCPAEYDGENGGATTTPEALADFIAAGGEAQCDPTTGEPVQ